MPAVHHGISQRLATERAMPHDERDDLLDRLLSLERQNLELHAELQEIKRELKRRASPGEDPRSIQPAEARPGDARPAGSPHALEVQVGADRHRPPGARQEETTAAAPSHAPEERLDLEYWLGGRGLLLLGVAALVLAVGFFVREAIERGWIGPLVRVLMGAGVGVVAVLIGERVRSTGYRTYGLWLSAGGFSAIYLSLWAATVLYGLITGTAGFFLMALVVALAAALGTLRDSESFVVLAAVGGYLAPLLLRLETDSNLFGLGYLGLLTAAGLWLAYRGGWTRLAAVAVVGGTILTTLNSGDPHLHGSYLVALAASGLLLFRRRRWHGLSLWLVLFSWASFWAGSIAWGIAELVFSAYAAGLWLVDLIATIGVTDWSSGVEDGDGTGGPVRHAGRLAVGPETGRLFREVSGLGLILLPPAFFFFSAMAGLDHEPYRSYLEEIGGALAAVLGAVYLAQAVRGERGKGAASGLWRAAVGFTFWLAVPRIVWSEIDAVRAWLVEGIGFTALGVWLGRVEARAAGLVALTLATLVFWGLISGRPAGEAAFVGGWALTGLVASLSFAGWSLAVARGDATSLELDLRPFLLLASAAFFLGWGTGEILRFYGDLEEPARWILARDLSISAFWLVYAAAILIAGFWLDQAAVRWGGLGMALIAAGKVFAYDLSQMSRLYRIFSFVLLAVVLLAVSYRYQRWQRS